MTNIRVPGGYLSKKDIIIAEAEFFISMNTYEDKITLIEDIQNNVIKKYDTVLTVSCIRSVLNNFIY